VDPLRQALALALYRYARNAPTLNWDPSGLIICDNICNIQTSEKKGSLKFNIEVRSATVGGNPGTSHAALQMFDDLKLALKIKDIIELVKATVEGTRELVEFLIEGVVDEQLSGSIQDNIEQLIPTIGPKLNCTTGVYIWIHVCWKECDWESCCIWSRMNWQDKCGWYKCVGGPGVGLDPVSGTWACDDKSEMARHVPRCLKEAVDAKDSGKLEDVE
jgi:hypothetical protein